MTKIITGLGLLCLTGLLTAGCTDADKDTTKKDVGTAHADSDHDHGHVHGPHGGEMFEFADAGLKGEWVAKYNQNLVTFYIYDQDGKTARPVKADKLVGSFKVAEVQTFDIPAVEPQDGMASRFETVSEELALAMKTSGINLEIEVDGKKYSTKLDKDPHAH